MICAGCLSIGLDLTEMQRQHPWLYAAKTPFVKMLPCHPEAHRTLLAHRSSQEHSSQIITPRAKLALSMRNLVAVR